MILQANIIIKCMTCTEEKKNPWEQVTFQSLSEAMSHWFDTKHEITIEVEDIDF